jgi:hypothetical protein
MSRPNGSIYLRPGALYTPIQVDTREARQIEGWGSKAGLGQRSKVATSFVFLASADASLYCRCLLLFEEDNLSLLSRALGTNLNPDVKTSRFCIVIPLGNKGPH